MSRKHRKSKLGCLPKIGAVGVILFIGSKACASEVKSQSLPDVNLSNSELPSFAEPLGATTTVGVGEIPEEIIVRIANGKCDFTNLSANGGVIRSKGAVLLWPESNNDAFQTSVVMAPGSAARFEGKIGCLPEEEGRKMLKSFADDDTAGYVAAIRNVVQLTIHD